MNHRINQISPEGSTNAKQSRIITSSGFPLKACGNEVEGYFQTPCVRFLTDKKGVRHYNFKHLGLRDLSRYRFSHYRDRSIYLRRLGEQTLALAFPSKRWHTHTRPKRISRPKRPTDGDGSKRYKKTMGSLRFSRTVGSRRTEVTKSSLNESSPLPGMTYFGNEN